MRLWSNSGRIGNAGIVPYGSMLILRIVCVCVCGGGGGGAAVVCFEPLFL